MGTTAAQRRRTAEAVRERRLAAGLTQGQLAELVGVHEQSIGNLERAQVDTSPETLAKISRVLQLDLDQASLATRETVDVITRTLYRKVDQLDHGQGMMLVGAVLSFISEWTPPVALEDEPGEPPPRETPRGGVLRAVASPR